MKRLRLAAAIFVLLTMTVPGIANAETATLNSCITNSTLQALGQLSGNTYDAYVKLGHGEDTASVSVSYSPFTSGDSSGASNCTNIGAVDANGANFTKVGQLVLANATNLGTFKLLIAGNSNETEGNAPSIVFVPTSGAACNITSNCLVTFEGKTMELLPQKINLTSAGLQVGVVTSITSNTIAEVLYSVDDQPVYSSKKLKPFNLNYVSNGEHTLHRKVLLETGQVLSDSAPVKRGSSGQIQYYLIARYYRSRVVINTFLIVTGAPLLILFSYVYVESRRRHKKWNNERSAANMQFSAQAQEQALQQLNAELHASRRDESFKDILLQFKWWILGVGTVLLGLWIFVAQAVTIFKVDGPSMEPTLKNGSPRLLVKLPVSLSKLNRSAYIPRRGDNIVFRHNASTLFDKTSTKSASYVVKRVIGLPGERVVVKDGIITVYDAVSGLGSEPDETEKWVKQLQPSYNYYVDITLKDGELFVVGDNRSVSVDSRSYGPITTSSIIGLVK